MCFASVYCYFLFIYSHLVHLLALMNLFISICSLFINLCLFTLIFLFRHLFSFTYSGLCPTFIDFSLNCSQVFVTNYLFLCFFSHIFFGLSVWKADADADRFIAEVESFEDVGAEVQRYRKLINEIQYHSEKVSTLMAVMNVMWTCVTYLYFTQHYARVTLYLADCAISCYKLHIYTYSSL